LSTDETFRQAVYETVETSLDAVLGVKIARALRFYVDLKSALRNPSRFFALMLELVGPMQAERLRRRVLSNLYVRYQLEYNPSGKSISEELTELKSRVKTLP
jgi:hypothetical protein